MPNIERFEKWLRQKPESFWARRGENMALRLFRDMAARVPAYRHFLKKHKINPGKITSAAELRQVPPTDKNGYLRTYPLKDLCWDGNIKTGAWTVSATSGTTGKPFYFPRKREQDLQYALVAELYLRTNFQIHEKSTLYINGFALGVWIGGLFTYEAVKTVAERGNYNLAIINPGINKREILNALKNLGSEFDQVIIGGYPPFVKDLVDEGALEGIAWQRYHIKFIFSAEAFSEAFRDYIIERARLKKPCLDTLNHYGTVDLGTMSYETPTSIMLRRRALEYPALYSGIFANVNRLPTLTQFLPELFYFEVLDGNLFCSAHSGIPLMRYDLKDRGGVMSFANMEALCRREGPSLPALAKKAGIFRTLWRLPFVYVYERSDLSVILYGANIDPEHIKEAHQHPSIIGRVSGRFTLDTASDERHNPRLVIHTELSRNGKVSTGLAAALARLVVAVLLEKNSEFRNNYRAMPERNTPEIKLWPYDTHAFFKREGKQRWSVK